MRTASDIVDLFGGPARLAEALDTPLTTVVSWREVNFIPRWWHQPLLALAGKDGKALSTADFPTREQRIPRAKKVDTEQASAA